MPSSQEIALANTTVVGHEIQFWRWMGPDYDDLYNATASANASFNNLTTEGAGFFLNEAEIVPGWLPSYPNGWLEVTNLIDIEAGISVDHDGTGYKLTFTILGEDRSFWPDDTPVALTARHYSAENGWGDWYLVCWARLTGAGTQSNAVGRGSNATRGQRVAEYVKYWDKLRMPATTFGRVNLAEGKTIAGATPPLLTPMVESGVEYRSATDVSPAKAIDGNADTVAISDYVATRATNQPLGDTMPYFPEVRPRVLRVYNGRQPERQIGTFNDCIFFELWAGHNLTPWGNMEGGAASLPAQNDPNDYPDGGQPPTIINNDIMENTLIADAQFAHSGTTYLRARFKQRYKADGITPAEPYIQWNLINSDYAGLPTKAGVWIKADSTASIGKFIEITFSQNYGNAQQRLNVSLSKTWTYYEATWDASTQYGGAVVRIRVAPYELTSDIYMAIDDFRLSVGYNDEIAAKLYNGRFWFAFDNGDPNIPLSSLAVGRSRWLRMAFDLADPGWSIPADGSIIITDDADLFKKKFDPGNKTVYQLKNIAPEFYFASGVGRLKTGAIQYATPARYNYDWTPPEPHMFTLYEEIDFGVANGGAPWTRDQALSRQNPIGTGFLAVENAPHTGLINEYVGASYWWVDLGEYTPGSITASYPATGTPPLLVDNIDEYPNFGKVRVGPLGPGGETMDYGAKLGNALVIVGRGSPAYQFDAGAAVRSSRTAGLSATDAGTASGIVPQTGWLSDLIEVRRKPGTPMILAGRLITSNLAAPRDPSDPGNSVGKKWQNHPDWKAVNVWTERSGNPDVISQRFPEGVRQFRHVCLVIDEMAMGPNGPQRAKVNEIVVKKYTPAAGPDGSWRSNQSGNINDARAFVLQAYAQFPASKIILRYPGAPITDLNIAPATVLANLNSLGGAGLSNYWLDPWNRVTIDVSPAHPFFDNQLTQWIWTEDQVSGDLGASYEEAHRVAQVRVSARDVNSLRVYTSRYPTVPRVFGTLDDINGLSVNSGSEADLIAYTAFRDRNARRSFNVTTLHALPWLRPYQRHTIQFNDLDAGGNTVGINCYVRGFGFRIQGGGTKPLTWTTAISLQEFAL